MSFTVLLFAKRKTGISPTEFQDHLEKKHIPFLTTIFGELFPLSHTRRYLSRSQDQEQGYPAAVLVGAQEDFNYDVVSELVFKDKSAFEAFFGKYQEPETAAAISEDEKLFLDSENMKAVVLGDVCKTTGPQ